jgi:hypothetical protein
VKRFRGRLKRLGDKGERLGKLEGGFKGREEVESQMRERDWDRERANDAEGYERLLNLLQLSRSLSDYSQVFLESFWSLSGYFINSLTVAKVFEAY